MESGSDQLHQFSNPSNPPSRQVRLKNAPGRAVDANTAPPRRQPSSDRRFASHGEFKTCFIEIIKTLRQSFTSHSFCPGVFPDRGYSPAFLKELFYILSCNYSTDCCLKPLLIITKNKNSCALGKKILARRMRI